MSLPARPKLTRLRFLHFELSHGLPTAFRLLAHHLGWLSAIRVFIHVAIRMMSSSALSGLSSTRLSPDKEWMTRRQLAQAVHLSDSLRSIGMPTPDVMRISQLIIATVGAKFVRSNADFELADWANASLQERETFAQDAMRRFPNVTQPTVTVGEGTMDVRFSYCRLAQGANEIGRPELASLFCSADAAFYNGTPTRPSLTRPHTIADGASECHFQFRWPAANHSDTTEQDTSSC